MISTQVIAGISIVIILLIVLLTVGGDGGNQGSGNNTPGYCKASASAEINQCVRPVWRYYLLFWPPRRSTRVLGVLARGVLGLLTRTFDFRTGELHALPRVLDRPDDQRLRHHPGVLYKLRRQLSLVLHHEQL